MGIVANLTSTENAAFGEALGDGWSYYGTPCYWQSRVYPYSKDSWQASLTVNVLWFGRWYIPGLGYCRSTEAAAEAANLFLAAKRAAFPLGH